METTLFVTKEYLEKQFKSFNNTLVKPNDRKIKEWLTTLNGDVDVEGSIANTIAKKIAEVISGAPEDYDTLKEISDWISNHASNAEEMLAKIDANKEGILSENEKIELVEGIINTLNGNVEVEGSIAKMLKDAINTSVDNIIICESEDEDIDFNSASWLKGEVLFTADMVTDKNITSFVIPEGVTKIDEGAFNGCRNLKSVTTPNTVTEIGNQAFYNCRALESIDIPEGVTKIGDLAFGRCEKLTTVSIPDTVTSIGSQAFYGCEKLGPITVPSSVTEVYFDSFPNIDNVTFAEGSPVHESDGYIYNGSTIILGATNKDITSFVIPEGVTEIGSGAFKNYTKLESVTLPSTLKKIGNNAFNGCSSLTSIDIPEGVTELGVAAFQRTALTSIEIPEGVTEISSHLFCQCDDLVSVTITEGVTVIADESIWQCHSLTSIEIPGTVTKIEAAAISGCTSLKTIVIHDGVKEIGETAFSGLPNDVNPIVIPASVTSIKLNSFNSAGWSKITFAEGSPFRIENGILYNGSEFVGVIDKTITSVTLPSNMKTIQDNAFNGCANLESITIPEGVTEIGYRAFYRCSSLTSITIPEGVTKIGQEIFSGCSSLTSIDIPEGVTEIERWAFSECTKLETVTLPSTLKKIGYSAFSGCTSLTSINIPEGVTQISNYDVFSDWSKVTFTEGSIFKKENGIIYNTETGVLLGCYDTSITSINVPEGVTEISDNTFSYCRNLESVTLPSTLTKIGSYVFFDGPPLSTINFAGSEEQWNAMTKGSIPSRANIVFNYQG